MAVMEVTTKIGCNVFCTYCPQEILLKSYRKRSDIFQMSFDVFKTCVDKLPSNVDILFTGMSEPWLNPSCTEMVTYAFAKGHSISVDTTLVGMTLSDIDQLKSLAFEYFAVHLPSAEGYESIRVNDYYLRLLQEISTTRIKCKTRFYHYYGENPHPDIKIPNMKRIPLYSRAGNIRIRGRPIPERKRGAIGCKRGLRWNVLFPNGDVGLCAEDWGLRHILGNLIESDYSSLFRSDAFLKVKQGLEEESLDILCRYCDERYSYHVGRLTKSLIFENLKNKHYVKEFLRLCKRIF